MSSTAVGKIIQGAGAGSDKKAAAKEAQQKTQEIVKELVSDVQQPAIQKRSPGRPKGSGSSPGRPKTPPHTLNEMNASQPPGKSVLNPAEQIRNQMLAQRLRLYVRKFPEYANFFTGYNPLDHHPNENQQIADAFLELIHSEVEFATAPAAISATIEGAEQAAVVWAIKNPTHPAAKIVEDLSGASGAILNDKAVSLDIRLLECEITGFLPKNPKLRLCLNVCRALAAHWSNNQLATATREGPPSSDSKETFKSL